MKKRCRISVDEQNDFCLHKGNLFVPNSSKIFPAIYELDSKAKLIIATGDAHDEDDVEFDTYPKHCVKGTWGANRLEWLKSPNLFMHKVTTNIGKESYFEEQFVEFVKTYNIGILDITGVVSHICVAGAINSIVEVSDKYDLKLKLFVYEDAIKGLDKDMHKEYLDLWKSDKYPSVTVSSVFKWLETTEEGKDIEEVVKDLQNGLNLNMKAYFGVEGKITDKEVDTRELVEGIYNPFLDKVYVR